jgi:hypothetical protein
LYAFKISYFFLLILLFFQGCERNITSDISGDGLPPAVPTNVKVYSAYDGEIELIWNANVEVDLKGYNIYRSTDSTNFSKIDFTDQNYYLDDSLDYSTKYFYRTSAIDIENRESETSSIVSAVPKNIYQPYAPKFLTINARNWVGEISVYLSWDPGYETDIAGFYIYRSLTSGFSPDSTNKVGFTNIPSYSDTSGLSLLTTYYYKIIAVDKGNLVSDPSSEVNDEILPIPQIISPIGTVATNYLNFKFIALAVPTTYEISLQSNPYFGEFWNKVITTNTVNDTITVSFDGNYLDYNINYYWRVSSYSGVSSDPNSISQLYNFVLVPQ